MTSIKKCPACGETFQCQMNEHCWCGKYPNIQEVPSSHNPAEDCLCEKCLDQLIMSKLQKKES